MAIETEKKYRLNEKQKARVLDSLKNCSAVFVREDIEENTIYGGGVLEQKSAVLRVRKIGGKTILTYKKRLENDAAVKQQIEHETEIADGQEIIKIIENLGFAPRIVYEKRRRTWNFRSVEVVLDELPFGEFMEIEGSLTAISEAEILLEIEDFPVEYETYPSLTLKFGKENDGIFEARF